MAGRHPLELTPEPAPSGAPVAEGRRPAASSGQAALRQRVQALAPETKLVAALVAVAAVVAAPRQAVVVHLVQALLVVGLALALGIGPRTLGRRLVIEAPFVAFAVLLPLVGRGERVDVGFLSLSRPGLWAAWAILAKGTVGLAVSVVLTATTSVSDLLGGLERLRLPRPLVLIASFMVRYLEVLRAEATRMRVARLSRAQEPRWLWQGRAVAATAGALFVRAYERGERVHVAMLARGWTGAQPPAESRHPPASDWVAANSLSVVMTAATVMAWWTR